uniref:Uncharacterized protein n=1 Tax=Tanacetum cinerariifolium TaxID=118510 RepID=A0A699KD78_TANCI|nr:hypothetical protein [Tanacetum cinerariifolium]
MSRPTVPLLLDFLSPVSLSIGDRTPPLIGAFWISKINWGFLKLVQDMDDCNNRKSIDDFTKGLIRWNLQTATSLRL